MTDPYLKLAPPIIPSKPIIPIVCCVREKSAATPETRGSSRPISAYLASESSLGQDLKIEKTLLLFTFETGAGSTWLVGDQGCHCLGIHCKGKEFLLNLLKSDMTTFGLIIYFKSYKVLVVKSEISCGGGEVGCQ